MTLRFLFAPAGAPPWERGARQEGGALRENNGGLGFIN